MLRDFFPPRGCVIFFTWEVAWFFVPRGCIFFIVLRECVMFFSFLRGCVIFLCPERLHDVFVGPRRCVFFVLTGCVMFFLVPRCCLICFLSREVVWFFCPERLRDFFCPRGCVFLVLRDYVIFLSWEIVLFFCTKRFCDLIFFVQRGCVSHWNFGVLGLNECVGVNFDLRRQTNVQTNVQHSCPWVKTIVSLYLPSPNFQNW